MSSRRSALEQQAECTLAGLHTGGGFVWRPQVRTRTVYPARPPSHHHSRRRAAKRMGIPHFEAEKGRVAAWQSWADADREPRIRVCRQQFASVPAKRISKSSAQGASQETRRVTSK